MTRRALSPSRSRAIITLLAAVFLTSGCVYLRLFQLKRQFGDFDQNFRADTTTDVSIECLKPLLHPDDVRWLGVDPESVLTPTSDAEKWHVRWIKALPPGVTESAVYDLELTLRFAGARLTHVDIPERYFAYFPKDLFIDLLRSTGNANIDRKHRAADIDNAQLHTPGLKIPDARSIGEMLGQPTSRTSDADSLSFSYTYKPVTTFAQPRPIVVTFEFSHPSGQLRFLTVKLPPGSIRFKMDPKNEQAPPAPPADPQPSTPR